MSNKLEWGFISKSQFSDSGVIEGDVIGLFNFLKIDDCAESVQLFSSTHTYWMHRWENKLKDLLQNNLMLLVNISNASILKRVIVNSVYMHQN